MLPVQYGQCSGANFLDAGERIAQDFTEDGTSAMATRINNTYFGGGALSPKRFSQLASVVSPMKPFVRSWAIDQPQVLMLESISFGECYGYLEAIPVIGSALAVIGLLAHLYGMATSYFMLSRAIVVLSQTPRNDRNVGRGASLLRTNEVFKTAVNFTQHRNQAIGSALAIVPGLKPVVRLVQGAVYHAFYAPPTPRTA